MIEAKVIEDSLAWSGARLTTLQLRYPRFIHAEFMTHRDFSRNASSSRAIPVAKMIHQVRTDPAMPVHWGVNRPGMQAHEELTGAERMTAQDQWRRAAAHAAGVAESLEMLGVHKQVANRILEPFQHISVIVSATEWVNFFQLRDHPDAQPEIRALAIEMKKAMAESVPRLITEGSEVAAGWHLPYVTLKERAEHFDEPRYLAKLSTARNARVSYLTHDGEVPDAAKDLALYDRLVGSVPLHASPTEHLGFPLGYHQSKWAKCKNFRGWYQFRMDVEAEMAAGSASSLSA